MNKLLQLSLFILLYSSSYSQALYLVSNEEKEQNSSLIVEGKVTNQHCFWDDEHRFIYTANTVKVFKLFKGAMQTDEVEILTVGGTVGNDNLSASDLLELSIGEVGTFFCFSNTFNLTSPVTGKLLYDVYASSQGFVKYNIDENRAADPLQNYGSIDKGWYPLLTKLTGQSFTNKGQNITFGKHLQQRPNAFISSFTPRTLNAGATSDPVNNVLTITGIGFGTPSAVAKVSFGDCNFDPSSNIKFDVPSTSDLIISWTDTEIKVKVPTRAGTGFVFVTDGSGSTSSSPYQLNVFYSILSFSGGGLTKQSNLANANSQGGYSMLYSTNMAAAASTTFTRALVTWREVAGLNVIDGGSTSTQNAAGDGKCVVFMDNAANGTPLSAGVLAVCYSFNSFCSPASTFDYRKTEFDVNIRSSYSTGSTTFAYGPCAPSQGTIDLETVLLHELGHGLNLGHIIAGPQGGVNPPKLMNYAVSNGVKRVSPDASCYQGALYTCTTNPAINFGLCTSATGMVNLTPLTEAKDECPLVFPTIPTQQGTLVSFDLAHATSNNNGDPQYTNVLCSFTGTAVTNNLYYVIMTDAGGTMTMDVSDFTVFPSDASFCSDLSVRLSVYQVSSCPTGQSFPSPIACRSFSGNGSIGALTGLAPNTTYLLYFDGNRNSKVTFKITFNGDALPIKLERFTGTVKSNFNELKWVIASYSDVNKICLERSANGKEFSTLSTYQGNVIVNREYVYNDEKPFVANNYYRLATYNKDGSIQYSKIVLLNRNENIKINIFPNPIKDNVSISINSSENVGNLQVRLYNNIGQLIMSNPIKVMEGMNKIEMNTSQLSTGGYKLIITNKNQEVIKSMSIQKL